MTVRGGRRLVVGFLAAGALLTGCATAIDGAPMPSAGSATATGSVVPGSAPVAGTTEPASSSSISGSAPSTGAAPPTAPSASGGPTDTIAATATTQPTSFSSFPRKLLTTPRTAAGAAVLEGMRIASSLLPPTYVDAAYKDGGGSTIPLAGPDDLHILFDDPVPDVASRAGMIAGFSTSRNDAAEDGLIVAAFEFPSAASALKAQTAISAASYSKDWSEKKAVIPGFPTASGWFGTIDQSSLAHVFLAQGPMVLYVGYLNGSTSAAKLTPVAEMQRLAAAALKVELPAMARFVPTPADQLMKLPIDPDGVLARTVPNTGIYATNNDSLAGPAAELHYESNPSSARSLFALAGVDQIANGRTSVYRARDAAGAAVIQGAYLSGLSGDWKPYTLTSSGPNAECVRKALDSAFYCVGVRGRYAYNFNADSEVATNALALAQDALLRTF